MTFFRKFPLVVWIWSSVLLLLLFQDRLLQIVFYFRYDKSKLEEYCAPQIPIVSRLVSDGKIRVEGNDWSNIYDTSLDSANVVNDRSASLLGIRVIALCIAHGPVSLWNADGTKRLAKAKLAPDMKVSLSEHSVANYSRPLSAPEDKSYKCYNDQRRLHWLAFESGAVMKRESDSDGIYVNANWRKIPVYEKEDILGYLADCKSAPYVNIYDGYTGKKIARNHPIFGIKFFD
jgi:hypothetical protein